MVKKVLVLLAINLFFLINAAAVLAERGVGESCGPSYTTNPNEPCERDKGYACVRESPIPGQSPTYSCKYSPTSARFGTIEPPDAIKGLLEGDPTGAGGISKLLSNLVALFYVIAAVVLVLMLIWGAFDWMTSEGEKEKLEGAKKKIINAIIGIMLFAVAFAIIQLLGKFSGFTFFVGQR